MFLKSTNDKNEKMTKGTNKNIKKSSSNPKTKNEKPFMWGE